jgi:antitoxin component YwqK of YwqJK toxin-antitoxin module
MSSEQFPLEECKYFFGNGRIREHSFHRNYKFEGEHKIWYEDGTLRMCAFYKNGELEESKFWHANGQPARLEIFEKGVLIEQKDWYNNGQIKLHKLFKVEKRWYKIEKNWYRNGQLFESACFRTDLYFEGNRKRWNENGTIKYHDFWTDGKLEGEDRTWLDTGVVKRVYWFRERSFDFNLKKKHGFLRMKKILRRQSHITDNYLIPDLSRVVSL